MILALAAPIPTLTLSKFIGPAKLTWLLPTTTGIGIGVFFKCGGLGAATIFVTVIFVVVVRVVVGVVVAALVLLVLLMLLLKSAKVWHRRFILIRSTIGSWLKTWKVLFPGLDI